MTVYGFTYNGTHSSTYGVYATSTVTGILPPVNSVSLNVPKRPGLWYTRTDLGPRWIQVHVSVTATSNMDLRTQIRNIAAWLSPASGLQSLSFDNEPNLTYYAVPDEGMGGGAGTQSTDITQMVTLGNGKVIFMCADPFAYDTQQSATFASDSASPDVTGTYQTYPVISLTLTAAATSLKVTHASSGKFMLLNSSFASGDTVTIDCTRGLVSINGSPAMTALDITSQFFALQPGANTLNITPTGVTSGSLNWTPRWL
ncbi:distal tail protein Dit [Alicyclobacillus sp. ALC3]|uniref:distal tail protein Dit n=1 Tax=Alicyclobacillus sp. ALC3 TaxID=2796143 RepID=UPI002378C73E|nr:distal tail protein Dit [Alicyclobacillus sp. ALC3]WDL97795.1 phage tail family protein [Alicyclobacillus sp. ALC3]